MPQASGASPPAPVHLLLLLCCCTAPSLIRNSAKTMNSASLLYKLEEEMREVCDKKLYGEYFQSAIYTNAGSAFTYPEAFSQFGSVKGPSRG